MYFASAEYKGATYSKILRVSVSIATAGVNKSQGKEGSVALGKHLKFVKIVNYKTHINVHCLFSCEFSFFYSSKPAFILSVRILLTYSRANMPIVCVYSLE